MNVHVHYATSENAFKGVVELCGTTTNGIESVRISSNDLPEEVRAKIARITCPPCRSLALEYAENIEHKEAKP